MRIVVPLVVVLCTLFAPTSAWAWNDTGHRLIATMAYDELTPAVRARVDSILRAHPRYDNDLLGEMPPEHAEPERYAFAMAGYWPDIIRSQSNPMHFTHHKPMWHYIDVRFELPDWKPATAPSTSAAGAGAATQLVVEGPKNAIEAIEKNREDLRKASTSDAEKAIAICWLAHLVADIHQPLHATTLYSAQFPDGDRGGNSFLVHVRRENQNLHAIWDQVLGLQTSPTMINYLAGSIRSDPNLTREALPQSGQSDPEVWKNESHALGRSVVYRGGTLAGASSEDVRRDPTTLVPALPEGYLRDAEPVALRRAALAGYRLADLLNAALGE
ncbi:MAG TPA: S1/P1 nuclease [Tepidisphaeraceae bacterium]|nr:S1/P1 nuclease [Tepidisphaeraceae bacterium]